MSLGIKILVHGFFALVYVGIAVVILRVQKRRTAV